MATSLKRLRKMNPAKPSFTTAAMNAGVAGASGVVASALGQVVAGNMQGYAKGAVKIGMGLATAIAVEMMAPRSSIACAAAYGACGALMDRGVDALGLYGKVGINMDGSSYYMGADDYDDEDADFMGADDYEIEDEDDFEVLDGRMGAISVQEGPLDYVSAIPGQSGLSARDTFRSVMSRV